MTPITAPMMTVLYHHPVTSNLLYNLLLTILPVAIFSGMTVIVHVSPIMLVLFHNKKLRYARLLIAASHPFIPTPNVAPIPQCIGYQIPVRRLI